MVANKKLEIITLCGFQEENIAIPIAIVPLPPSIPAEYVPVIMSGSYAPAKPINDDPIIIATYLLKITLIPRTSIALGFSPIPLVSKPIFVL